jgi:hypothetical protein
MAARKRSQLDPAIHRVPIDRLRIFDVSEDELESLERGSTESIFLNPAIGVLSVAISLSASLATATFPNDRAFYVFVILTVIGYIAGLAFGLLWLVSRKSLKSVSARIRSRIPPEGEQADDDAEQT